MNNETEDFLGKRKEMNPKFVTSLENRSGVPSKAAQNRL